MRILYDMYSGRFLLSNKPDRVLPLMLWLNFVVAMVAGIKLTGAVWWPGSEALLRSSVEERGCGALDLVFSPPGLVLFSMEERRGAKEVEMIRIWCCPWWPRLLVLVIFMAVVELMLGAVGIGPSFLADKETEGEEV